MGQLSKLATSMPALKLSFEEWQRQRQEPRPKELSDELARLGIKVTTEELAESNWLQIAVLDYIDSAKKCLNCKSAKDCTQDSKGMKLDIDIKRGILTVKPCDKYNRYKHSCELKNTLETAKISSVCKHMTLNSYEDGDKRKALAESIADSGRWLFAYGSAGVGKTHMAVAILQELLNRDKSGLFCTTPTLMNELRRLTFKDSNAFYELLDKVLNCDVLLLDDLGAEKATDKVGEWLYLIINDRYLNNRQTLITSNLSLDEITAQLGMQGSRITSRIVGKAEVIKLGGADRRMNEKR